jgi:hypothetical protein
LSYIDSLYIADDENNPPNSFSHIDIWIEPISNLAQVHELRQILNSGTCLKKDLKRFSPEIIADAIKLYLLELPNSVCSDEIYNPIKILYLSSFFY